MSQTKPPVPEKARGSLEDAWAITGHGDRWMVVHTLETDWAGHNYRVPIRFVTDLASVPRLFWIAFPPFGRFTAAAIVHDWLYAHRQDLQGRPITRLEADRVFLGLMIETGTFLWRAAIFYRLVRIFGGRAFKSAPARWAEAQAELLASESP